jgi:3-hydroxyacyl-[acyl-carrier-protein] dehydratase
MEQLTAICFEDTQRGICVGYKDLGPDEFWARGHFPGMPVMPGVLMCETAAQLASYYAAKHHCIDGMVGFGGLEDVRFRDVVRPGDRFVVINHLLRARRSIMTCEFQCLVRETLVCEGVLKGVALPVRQLTGSDE